MSEKRKKFTDGDLYVQRQAEGQSKDYKTEARRYLDFTPFLQDLEGMDEERYKEIGEIVIEKTVPEIQAAVQKDLLTYEELTCFYINRIKAIDHKQLNAIMQLNPDAIAIARDQDNLRKQHGVQGQLQGIPIVLKDNIGTGDKMTNTAGAKVLEHATCPRDSFLAKRLREAGAVIIGKANLSEWANFMSSESYNGYSTLGGQTHNPYGAYEVGGSSSGSGVVASANLATLAIGTETTGSILSPASQNSVVGLKPTVGLWSRDLIIPIAHDLDTAGPITRTVEDAAILLGALTGEDQRDDFTLGTDQFKKEDYTAYLRKDGLQGMRIGLVTNKIIVDWHRAGEMEILDRIVKELESLGAEVVHVQVPDESLRLERREVMYYEYRQDVEAYLSAIGEHAPVHTIAEIAAFNNEDLENRAKFDQALIEEARDTTITEEEHLARVEKNARLTSQAIDKTLEENKLDLLMGTYVSLSGLYAIARYPSIIVPAGYREDGEPIGLSLVASKFREDLLIKGAYAYEQGTKHRKQPLKS